MADTRERLIEGALDAMRTHGIAGVSARSIAAAAGVNQALVFYHFGSVDELLAAAVRHGAQQRVATYRERLGAVTSLRDLLDLGRSLHADERAAGNLAVLAQMLAGAERDARLGPRSEEHTSELQSRRDLVCRLLLEKKKTATRYRRAARARDGPI